MARPSGRFEQQCQKFWSVVKDLSQQHSYCFASNEYLSKVMRVGAKQLERYLTALKKQKKLWVQTVKYVLDGEWRTYRRIIPRKEKSLWAKPLYSHLLTLHKTTRREIREQHERGLELEKELAGLNEMFDRLEAQKPPPSQDPRWIRHCNQMRAKYCVEVFGNKIPGFQGA